MLAAVCVLLALGVQSPKAISVFDQSGHAVAPFAIQPAEPTVLFYVMSGCPISAKYSPEIARLCKAYPKVRFFIVHADKTATAADAKEHRKEFSIPCPELLDPKHKLVALGKPTTVPTVALFDAKAKMRYRGRIDDRFPALGVELAKPRRQDLRIALNEVLAGKPVSMPETPVVGCALPAR